MDAVPPSEGPSSCRSTTSTSGPTPLAAKDVQKRRVCAQSCLQWVAGVVAIASFLYLCPFPNLNPWPYLSTEQDVAGLSDNLPALNATEFDCCSVLNKDSANKSEEVQRRSTQKKIPRFIHQTYKTDQIPDHMKPLVESWKYRNPSWNYFFYNDTQCLDFVEKEFPEYLAAYNALRKTVERSDFFRYMVILRYGGVYADLDTECVIPMDNLIEVDDEMIVGWECDMPSDGAAVRRHFVRRRQVLQWVFAAAPGHPALKEMCDFIANTTGQQFSTVSSNHDTLERTGPGAWTDTIVRHVSPPNQKNRIRILPQVSFGSHPSGTDDIFPDSPGILVRHHFFGSWKTSYWGYQRELQMLESSLGLEEFSLVKSIKPLPISHFPVSADFEPAFTIVVHSADEGAYVADSDVSAAITRWGAWQAGRLPPRHPRLIDVLAGSLGEANVHLGLLDIGAGLGFFSLAAASRRHPVIALEATSSNIEPFNMSIHANGFAETLKLYTTVDDFKNISRIFCTKTTDEMTNDTSLGERTSSEEEDEEEDTKDDADCVMQVAALRIGFSGWSLWNDIHGSDYIRQHHPEIVAIEYAPWKMRCHGWENPRRFLQEIVGLGYGEVYHAGYLCERRWKALIRHVKNFNEHAAPSWCNVATTDLEIFDRMEDNEWQAPENILFVDSDKKRK